MCVFTRAADGPAIVRQRVFFFSLENALAHTHVYKKYKTIFVKKKIITRFVNRTRAEHSSALKRYEIYFRSITGRVGLGGETRRNIIADHRADIINSEKKLARDVRNGTKTSQAFKECIA